MTKLNIELRKITYSKALSDETNAYTADLYLDGKLLAHVMNAGHGGCDSQHPAKGRTYDEIKALNDLIKSTYPARDTGMVLNDKPFIMEQDLETICGELLDEHLVSKDLKRLLSTKIAFKKPDGLYTVKKVKGSEDEQIAAIKAKNGIEQTLNEMPFERALEIYRATAS